MKNITGVYDLKKNTYNDESENVYLFDNKDYSLRIFGRAEIDDTINDGKKITDIFKKNGQSFTEHVYGVFICMIFDKKSKALYAFHDRNTSSATLYYTRKQDEVYISTSLRLLLQKSHIQRAFNEEALPEFMLNGFIYGRKTLISEVYKVEAYHCLKIEDDDVSQSPVAYPVNEINPGEALNSFRETLESAILSQVKGEDDVSLPLSGGYDSNYICHVLTENTDKEITAFSVGGKSGKNELPVVEKNISYYKNLRLKSALTDSSSLQSLPDIVRRLEGNVYECGLFLQYELAKLVSSEGKKLLICGECADQVMNMYYLQNDRIDVDSEPDEPIYYDFSEYPFIFGSYLILKKNGILMNSFDIETRYPYLDKGVVTVSNTLKYINQKDKRVHVANCMECLPPEVIDNMSKVGGSTDCHSLFDSDADIRAFFKKIENTGFYQKYKYIIDDSKPEEEIQSGINLLKTKIRNTVLKKGSDYYLEEVKLRRYVGIAYLIVFKELFIAGNYDLNSDKFSKTFDDFLK